MALAVNKMSSLKSLSTTCGPRVIPNTQINRSSIEALCMIDLQEDTENAIPSLLHAAFAKLIAVSDALK